MESKVLTLLGHLTFLGIVAFVIATLVGKPNLVAIRHKPRSPRRMNKNSSVWNQSPVEGPNASPGLLFTPSAVMYPGE